MCRENFTSCMEYIVKIEKCMFGFCMLNGKFLEKFPAAVVFMYIKFYINHEKLVKNVWQLTITCKFSMQSQLGCALGYALILISVCCSTCPAINSVLFSASLLNVWNDVFFRTLTQLVYVLLIIPDKVRVDKHKCLRWCHAFIWLYGTIFVFASTCFGGQFEYAEDYITHNECTCRLTFYRTKDGSECLLDRNTSIAFFTFYLIYFDMAILSVLYFYLHF